MHILYRKHMNAIDLHNKMSMQLGTLTDIWRITKS